MLTRIEKWRGMWRGRWREGWRGKWRGRANYTRIQGIYGREVWSVRRGLPGSRCNREHVITSVDTAVRELIWPESEEMEEAVSVVVVVVAGITRARFLGLSGYADSAGRCRLA